MERMKSMKRTEKLLMLILSVALISISASAFSASVTAVTAVSPELQATFSTNPTIIAPGSDGYIQLTLENTGTATASRIKISSAFWDLPVTPSGKWLVELGALGAGDSTTALFKFSVPSTASSGLYTANFDIYYCHDTSCGTINPNAIITVQVPTALELLSVKPSSLNTGENATLVFKLANTGKNSINNIMFTWQASSDLILPLGSDNKIIVPIINGGQSIEIPADVVVSPSITPNLYSLTIKMEYYDQTGVKQNTTSTAGILIGGVSDFDVSVQDSTATSTTLAIANVGANTAYSVIVSIPQQENFRVTGTSANVMGNLDAGDYTLASFQITATAATRTSNISAGSEKNLVVKISYTDTLGVRRTVQKEVSLGIAGTIEGGIAARSTQGNQLQVPGGNGLLYIGIGIVGIVGIVMFLKIRKRIKRKRE